MVVPEGGLPFLELQSIQGRLIPLPPGSLAKAPSCHRATWVLPSWGTSLALAGEKEVGFLSPKDKTTHMYCVSLLFIIVHRFYCIGSMGEQHLKGKHA